MDPRAAGKGKDKEHDTALPWVEKYRPQRLEDLVSHQDIIHTITHLISLNKLPHLLFYGPPGTGKTSTILACARQLYGERYHSMTLELNASDDRGIDVVRQQVKDFASTRNVFSSGFKLIVLDEADAMTSAAQFALRRIIEKYTKNARFCLICNHVSKIIPALQSRCTRFRFAPLDENQCRERVESVLAQEQVNATSDGIQAVVRLGYGDMRKCLNILQSTHTAYGTINENNVYACTGSPLPSDMEQIVQWLLEQGFSEACTYMQDLKVRKGLALHDILVQLYTHVLRLKFEPRVRIYLLDKLATIEHQLSVGGSERLQLGAVVSAFQVARDMCV